MTEDTPNRAVTGNEWHETRRLDDGVTLIRESHIKTFFRCDIWHVRGRDRDLLVDSGMGVVSLRDHARLVCERPLVAVASHAQFDLSAAITSSRNALCTPRKRKSWPIPSLRNTLADIWVSGDMFATLPSADCRVADYEVRPAPASLLLREGDVVDLGDRHFEAIHLPGQSPGSISLWEVSTGVLFSGDVVYDGVLLDNACHSNVDDYLASMERLRGIPVRTVHAAHFASFGRNRMLALIDEYVAGRRAPGCPASHP